MNAPEIEVTKREIADLVQACITAAEHLKHGYATGGRVTADDEARVKRYAALARALWAKIDG